MPARHKKRLPPRAPSGSRSLLTLFNHLPAVSSPLHGSCSEFTLNHLLVPNQQPSCGGMRVPSCLTPFYTTTSCLQLLMCCPAAGPGHSTCCCCCWWRLGRCMGPWLTLTRMPSTPTVVLNMTACHSSSSTLHAPQALPQEPCSPPGMPCGREHRASV